MAGVEEAFLKNEAIRNNFDKLARGMEADRVSIANQCYAKALMPQVMLNATPTEMLKVIQSQVAADGTEYTFQAFCDILQDETSTAHLAQSLLKSLQLLRTGEKFRKRRHYTKVKDSNFDSSAFPILSPFLQSEEFDKNLEEIQKDITSDTTSDEETDEEGEDENNEQELVKFGHIESVTNPEFDNHYQRNRRYKRTLSPSGRPSHTSLPSSPLHKRFTHLTIRDHQEGNHDLKCCRHLTEINKLKQEKNDMAREFKEAILWERGQHQQKVKLMKWERRQHMKNLKHKVCHLRLWLKESKDREEQLHRKMQYMDLYYEEVQGYNSQLQQRIQVEQEKLAKCLDKKDNLREKVSALESLLTVSQNDCHRHYLAEMQLREKVRELEEKVSKLDTTCGRDDTNTETSHHSDSPDLTSSLFSGYSSGQFSSHGSCRTTPQTTPTTTPLATPPFTSPSHTSNSLASNISNHSPNWSPNHSCSLSPNHSFSHSLNS